MVIDQISAGIYAAVDAVFAPLAAFPTYVSIIFIALSLTAVILVLNRLLIKQNIVKGIKVKMEEIKENLNKAQKEGNKEIVDNLMGEMLKTNNEYMRHTLKALVVSTLVALLIFPWVSQKYQGLAVATLPFSMPLVGTVLDGIGWYILVSLTLGWVLNKLFGAH